MTTRVPEKRESKPNFFTAGMHEPHNIKRGIATRYVSVTMSRRRHVKRKIGGFVGLQRSETYQLGPEVPCYDRHSLPGSGYICQYPRNGRQDANKVIWTQSQVAPVMKKMS